MSCTLLNYEVKKSGQIVRIQGQVPSSLPNSAVLRIHKRYTPMKVIQELQQGAVMIFSANDSWTGEKVTIKRVRCESKLKRKHVLRDVKILKHLDHPNILKCIDLFKAKFQETSPSEDYYIVLKGILPSSTLKQMIEKSIIPIPKVAEIIYQLLCVLKYIHSANVIHQALTLDNIFVDPQNYTVMVSTCDVSQPLAPIDSPNDEKFDRAANAAPMSRLDAPEMLYAPNEEYGVAVDVWRVGVLLLEAVTRHDLFTKEKDDTPASMVCKMIQVCGLNEDDYQVISDVAVLEELLDRNIKSKEQSIGKLIPGHESVQIAGDCVDLVSKMLVFNPNNRISADDALKHRFFMGISDSDDLQVCECKSPLDCEFEYAVVTRDNMIAFLAAEIKGFRQENALQFELEVQDDTTTIASFDKRSGRSYISSNYTRK
eukprot:TRINITY_DN163_c0_g1_i1.p1 TRINITY_DN163_c0_g1~~TRINITY_DN163_c0_g1_i1.p1  ORF type:complete len:428 (-),score=103.12 TRINITY_DN163_c0_g1_i1:931-2214(-)